MSVYKTVIKTLMMFTELMLRGKAFLLAPIHQHILKKKKKKMKKKKKKKILLSDPLSAGLRIC